MRGDQGFFLGTVKMLGSRRPVDYHIDVVYTACMPVVYRNAVTIGTQAVTALKMMSALATTTCILDEQRSRVQRVSVTETDVDL